MDDDDAALYELRAPAAALGESVASQLQREILGDAGGALFEVDAGVASLKHAPATPLATPREQQPEPDDLVAIATPEALSQRDEPQHDAQPEGRGDDRRRTLSPSKALAFFSQEGITDSLLTSAASRRDTVSPEAIRSLLQGLDGSGAKERRASIASALGLDPTDESVDEGVLSEYLHDVARTKQYLESSKLTLLQTPKGAKRRRSAGGRSGKTQSKGMNTTADQDSFTDAFFSSKLLSRDDGDADEDRDDDTIDSISGAAGTSRRATLEPMDAQAILSELQFELDAPDRMSKQEEAPPVTHTRQPSRDPAPSPNTRGRKRRATIDPHDLVTMRENEATSSTSVSVNRRETIGDGDLAELRREMGIDSPSEPRKRDSLPEEPKPEPSKRTRFNDDSLVVHMGDSSTQATSKSPTRQVTPSKDSVLPAAEADALISPPPTNRANKTPLKSCLSARKAKRDQATPTKSVNFGPPQGAEFNLGSPSTSMTPMLARDARAMFPLKEKSPPVSDDDDETSLNTSILDEADARDSSDDEDAFAIIQQRKLSVEPSTSTRTRRRYSLRGVSPLDNQANARRERRLSTASIPSQRSPLISARNRRASEAAAAVSNTSGAVMKTSFLSKSETLPQSRLAYADSSASSDEGEDMEITGDYSDHAAAASNLQNGRPSPNVTSVDGKSPRRSARFSTNQDSLFVDSPLSDTTIELGTLRELLEESSKLDRPMPEVRVASDSSDEDDPSTSMGSLGDLAKETEDIDEQQHHLGGSGSQELPLETIVEGDEDRRSSSAHSMMSIESDDDSDDEYNAKRKSLVVNLSSKFERFGSGSPKKRTQSDRIKSPSSLYDQHMQSPKHTPKKSPLPSRVPTPSPQKLPDPLRINELLLNVELDTISSEVVETIDLDSMMSETQRSCVSSASGSTLRYSSTELQSWCSSLDYSHSSMTEEKLSRYFTTDNDAVRPLMRSLHDVESRRVRGGFCQWRTKLEKRVVGELDQCEEALRNDIKLLRGALDNDRLYRERELQGVKDRMERERQMEQLLDGIEEQRSVQREYQSSVEQLENECSSLSLEASILAQQLASIQESSPQVDVSDIVESQLREDVLELDELMAVRENVGMWRIVSVNNAATLITSRYDDVLFTIEIQVAVSILSDADASGIKIVPKLLPRTQKQRSEISNGVNDVDDVVFAVASLILSPDQLVMFQPEKGNPALAPSHLLRFSTFLRRAYHFLSSLRKISTMCDLRLVQDNEQTLLWIDFVRFPRLHLNTPTVEGLKFSLGWEVTNKWPFVDVVKQIYVASGVTKEKIQQQVDEVANAGTHGYFLSVCRRLVEVFVCDD